MNKTFALIASAAALVASSAFAVQTAEDAPPISAQAFDGAPVTQAQVQAELSQYLQQLRSQPASAEDPRFVAADNAPALTRAQVQANLNNWIEKRAAGPARAEDGAPL